MNNYELTFIMDTQIEEHLTESTIEKVENLLKGGGAEVVNVDRWGIRKLAYPVKKREQGLYVVVQFRAEGSLIREVERELLLDEVILRYLVIALEEELVAKEET